MRLENKLINRYRNLDPQNKPVIWALAALGGIALVTNIGTRVETDCETYQGYRNIPDGERLYIFDEKTLEKRINGPNYGLLGKLEWNKDLKIGNKYRLEIRDPVLPLSPKRLLSYKKCE